MAPMEGTLMLAMYFELPPWLPIAIIMTVIAFGLALAALVWIIFRNRKRGR
jgi:hypothetical protein